MPLQMQMLLNTVGSVFYLGCQWLVTVLVVRMAGYDAAGDLTFAVSITNIFSVIALFTMRQFQISDLENRYVDKEYIASRYFTSLLAFLLCLLYLLLFCDNGRRQFFCVIGYMGIKVTEALSDVFHGILQRQVRYHAICLSYLLRGAVLLASFAGLLAKTGNVALALVIVSIELFIICFAYDRRKINISQIGMGDVDRGKVRGLLGICFPLVIYNFIMNYIPAFPRLKYAGLYGAGQLGVFGAVSAPTMLINVLAVLMLNPLVPFFSRYYKERDGCRFWELFRKAAAAMSFIGVASVLAAGGVGKALLVGLFGDGMGAYADILPPVVLGSVLTAVVWVCSDILIAMRRIRELLSISVCVMAVELIAAEKMLLLWEMDGISYCVIIFFGMMSVAFLVTIWITMRKRGECG